MIFLDTSAIYALADLSDKNHKAAKQTFASLLTAGEELLLHNYILVESLALIQHRLGIPQSKVFLSEAKQFRIVWIDLSLHAKAAEYFMQQGKRGVSFVDSTSFVVMRENGIKKAFAFDDDFAKAGFKIY